MGIRDSARVRLSGVALLVAMVAGCGGGGGSGGAPVEPPVAPPPESPMLDWDVHPAASVVLGQDTFDSGAPGDLALLNGSPAVTTNGWLYVATEGALKGFQHYAAGGATAQLSYGSEFVVRGVHARGNKLAMVDGDYIYIYSNAPEADGVFPDVFSSGANGCGAAGLNVPQAAFLAPSGHLIVADRGNHRVLIWNPDRVPSQGALPEPSVVVGQPDVDTCSGSETANEFNLSFPRAVWSDGTRMVVVDEGNHRLLVWDEIPSQDFRPANWVVGQRSFTEFLRNRGESPSEFSLSSPRSVDVNEAGQMAVADRDNHRVLVWNSVPRAHSAPADHVLGQGSFTHNIENNEDQVGGADGPSDRTLRAPTGALFHDRNLIVVDHGNNRVLVFPASN